MIVMVVVVMMTMNHSDNGGMIMMRGTDCIVTISHSISQVVLLFKTIFETITLQKNELDTNLSF